MVEQDFEPDNPRASVSVSVRCTEGGSPDASPKPSSEDAPAEFAISDFGTGATCTATVSAPPAGYTTDVSKCRSISISDSASASCTVTSSRTSPGSVAFLVTKDFEPGSRATVSVSVECTSGRPDTSPKDASEGAPAVFTISGFRPGATCTATEEAAPAGYTSSERGCRDVAIASGRPTACTITNTRETAGSGSVTFLVTKDFEPGSRATVSVSLECTSGRPDASPKDASEGAAALFTISGVDPGATCTATEGKAPTGYTSNQRDCRSVAIAEKPSCTIINKLNSATFSVAREFEDGSTTGVVIGFICDSGTVEPAQETAGKGFPALFTVTGFTGDPTCTATTVTTLRGYDRDESACDAVQLGAGECTIEYLAHPG
jgi:hypothetical protein